MDAPAMCGRYRLSQAERFAEINDIRLGIIDYRQACESVKKSGVQAPTRAGAKRGSGLGGNTSRTAPLAAGTGVCEPTA
jgi:hypothetical protein